MTETYSPAQVVLQVAQLTHSRLGAFVETEAVSPRQTAAGPRFEAADLARLTLLCELEELYGMTPEALSVLITVIDQMHAARQDRRCLMAAIAQEAVEVQMRVAAILAGAVPDPV